MAREILDAIEKAEVLAEQTRAQALREARELIKGVDEASAASERAAALDARTEVNRILESARTIANRKQLEEADASAHARADQVDKAHTRVNEAASIIVERVLSHGDR